GIIQAIDPMLEIVDLLPGAAEAAGHEQDVAQDSQPDEAIGGAHELRRGELLARGVLDLHELLRRGARGAERVDARACGEGEGGGDEAADFHDRISRRSSTESSSSARVARACASRSRSARSRPHVSVMSAKEAQNAGRIRGSSEGTTVVCG